MNLYLRIASRRAMTPDEQRRTLWLGMQWPRARVAMRSWAFAAETRAMVREIGDVFGYIERRVAELEPRRREMN